MFRTTRSRVLVAVALMVTVALGTLAAISVPLGVRSKGLAVSFPAFVGTHDAIRIGAESALGSTIDNLAVSQLPNLSVDLLFLDLEWLIVSAGQTEIDAIEGYLLDGKVLVLVQLGENLTDAQVEAFFQRTADWPIGLSFLERGEIPETLEEHVNATVPSEEFVSVSARLVQLDPAALPDKVFVRSEKLAERTGYTWDQADLAVRQVLGRVLKAAGVGS